MPPSFREYVMGRRITDTPAGDFVSDAKSDKTFPDAASWKEIESYLRLKGACSDAVIAGKEVWKAYKARRAGPDLETN